MLIGGDIQGEEGIIGQVQPRKGEAMKAKYVVVPVWNRKQAHAILSGFKRQTLCGLEWKGTQWKDWPAKVKKCPQCQAALQGKLEEYFEKHSGPVKETSDLKKQVVKVGDEWEAYSGHKFKVLKVDQDIVRIRWTTARQGGVTLVEDVFRTSDIFRKLEYRDEVKVEEPVKELFDLRVYGIRNGDLWETAKGDRFRVVYLHFNDESKLKEVEYQWVESQNTTNKKEMTGIDYPFFHNLIERDGQVVKENEKKEDVLVVKVGDIWRSDCKATVEVLAVDDGNFFCKYHTYGGALDRIVVTPREVNERKIFHQLVKRDGKDVVVKRMKPTYGMDLASYGVHQGDYWQDVEGQGFTVVAIEDDGKGRIQAVNIETLVGGLLSRARLDKVNPDCFAYLVERDGKSMEEA